MSVTLKPVDAFSQLWCGSQSKAQLGGPCQKFMGIGIASIGVSGDGVMPGSLKNFMNISMMRGEISALLVDSTIVRAHSSAAGAPEKKTEVKTQRHSVEATAVLRRNSMRR